MRPNQVAREVLQALEDKEPSHCDLCDHVVTDTDNIFETEEGTYICQRCFERDLDVEPDYEPRRTN